MGFFVVENPCFYTVVHCGYTAALCFVSTLPTGFMILYSVVINILLKVNVDRVLRNQQCFRYNAGDVRIFFKG